MRPRASLGAIASPAERRELDAWLCGAWCALGAAAFSAACTAGLTMSLPPAAAPHTDLLLGDLETLPAREPAVIAIRDTIDGADAVLSRITQPATSAVSEPAVSTSLQRHSGRGPGAHAAPCPASAQDDR